jgi:RNA polymerase sigma factor (sigma-70 family)
MSDAAPPTHSADVPTADELLPLVYDELRRMAARKLSGEKPEPLEESRIAIVASSDELIAVNDSLEQLETEDPRSAEVVRLRYFVGMTVPEIATALDLSPRTVDRQWAFARAWLKREIRGAV